MPVTEAEQERLATILREERIATSTAGPDPFQWLQDVIGRALEELLVGSFPAVAGSAGVLAIVVLIVVGLLAGVLTVRMVRLLRAGARVAPEPTASTARLTTLPPPSRAAIDERLAAGDAAGALRALWRWVAANVEARGYARPTPDRTNRELLDEVRRAAPGWDRLPALTRLTRAVDNLLYGGVPLDADAVRALLPLADQVVA